MRSKKDLAVTLSHLKGFESPNVLREQYPTDPEAAASLVWTAMMRDDIDGKTVVDLGCGTGILSCAALLLGAQKVIAVDIDEAVAASLKENLASLELPPVEFVHADVATYRISADTVIMNPPFGVQRSHADRIFLESAFAIAPRVYSIHKAESHSFLAQFAADHDFAYQPLEERDLMIRSTQKFHTHRLHRFRAVLCLFTKNNPK